MSNVAAVGKVALRIGHRRLYSVSRPQSALNAEAAKPMIGRIQGARVSRKAALVVVMLALAAWAVVVYVNVRDFVPDEFTEPTPESRR